ncbi:MAG: DUF3552 domain-containing protein, partial [Chloroflexi bacterium]|nr:DUF3552 domain-containing protein [Chloroflexota bacterium]
MQIDTTVYLIALISIFVIGFIGGGAVVFFFRRMAITHQLRVAQRKATRTESEARLEAKEILAEAKKEAEKTKSITEAEYRERRTELQRLESRLVANTETLERKLEGVDQRERNLANKEKGVEAIRAELGGIRDKQLKQLEMVSGMSSA